MTLSLKQERTLVCTKVIKIMGVIGANGYGYL
jgi:hypothetical protein